VFGWREPPTKEILIRRSITAVIALIALVAVAVPALAESSERSVNVPHKFRKLIPKVREKSGIPVRVPQELEVDVKPSRVHPSGGATKHAWDLELGIGKNCGGGNACFVAAFSGTWHGKPSFKHKVKLAFDHTGYYEPVHCGASCAPAFIQWKQGGVLYEIQNKDVFKHPKRTMIRLANSAINHGPR
jgi:hypothetical protein